MPLDPPDREWLENKFQAITDHIIELQRDLAITRTEFMGHLSATRCRQVTEHEERRHDSAKTWGLIGAIIAATAGGLELLRRVL
jgi:hypothetical protein